MQIMLNLLPDIRIHLQKNLAKATGKSGQIWKAI